MSMTSVVTKERKIQIIKEQKVDSGRLQLLQNEKGFYSIRAIWDNNGTENWGVLSRDINYNNTQMVENFYLMYQRWLP